MASSVSLAATLIGPVYTADSVVGAVPLAVDFRGVTRGVESPSLVQL